MEGGCLRMVIGIFLFPCRKNRMVKDFSFPLPRLRGLCFLFLRKGIRIVLRVLDLRYLLHKLCIHKLCMRE